MAENLSAYEEFKAFSAVPRRSYHNEKAIAYCLDWAKTHGLESFYDEANQNVVIRRKACTGKEQHPGIIVQGHLDMVDQCAPGVEHDWEAQGLELIEDGDFVRANGTTLGADNGGAIAIALALLTDPELKNPPMEAFFTTNEEVGMDSVKFADLSYLQGKLLLNIDGGEEGKFITGCCGGRHVHLFIPKEKEEQEGFLVSLTVTGLKGGHSGIEIGNERANALKVLGKVLYRIGKRFDFCISSLKAEGKENAISREASAQLCVFCGAQDLTCLQELISDTETDLRYIFRKADPDLRIQTSFSEAPEKISCCPKTISNGLAFLLHTLPFGVQHLDQDGSGAIETSLNKGVIEETEQGKELVISIRSSVPERGQEFVDLIFAMAKMAGIKAIETDKCYPAWQPEADNPLVDVFTETYRKLYGAEPQVGPIHAGLECGYILANSEIDYAISLGPEISGEHTFEEAMSISSLERTYQLVKEAIAAL